MRKHIFLTVLSVLFFSESTKAQCQYNALGFYMSLSAPTTIGGIASDNCIWGGEYITCTGLVAGNTYRVSTVGNTSFDTEITIFKNGLAVAYNDDAPTGTLQSEIYFTPTVTGDYDIQVNEYDCLSNNICMDLQVELEFVPVSVVTIPVVFHVVHYGEAYGVGRNISDAQIQDQINILNQDYRRMNSDFNNTPAIFAGVSADVQIEFCLAQRDPNGNSTSGIIRWLAANPTYSKANFSANIKPLTSWDRDSYLNFWIADITPNPPSTGVLYGFATFPDPVFPANTDGVVCHYRTIGVSPNNFTTANKGRTATHEVGHWLGLYHTFEGGCNGVGDNCFDTPYQEHSTWSSPGNSNCPGSFQSAVYSCGSYDMYPNYMDYTDDDCLSMFTFGQKSRTRSTLLNFRGSLQSSLGCVPCPPSISTSITACNSYTWSVNGTTYTTSGTYTHVITSNGCTHTETLILTINNSTSNSTTQSACDSYTWSVNGTTYSTSGTYTDVSTNAAGCTHTETLNLTINNSTSNSTTQTACDSYTWSVNSTTYSTSGTYTDVSTNAAGCTHTETLNLTINSSTSNTTTLAACNSYTWSVNGTTYSTSGPYIDVSTNAAGCTHTENLNLTINNSTSNSTTQSACDSYTWSVNSTTYSTSGTYTDVSTNSAGCTHTETLNLTINSSSSNSTIATACDTYTWSVNGTTYSTSGTYTDVNGCHTETLDLTITNSTSNSTSVTTCDSYTWSVDGNTYTTSGAYTDVSTNANGCDHTETLDLTINNSTSNSTTATACDTYTWTINGQIYTTGGTYTDISTNTAGCTHTETLNLTINNSIISSVLATACDSYNWNGTDYTSSGAYTWNGTNAAGCDSTATLHLTIHNSTTSSEDVISCDSVVWNGTTYTTSGTYDWAGVNAVGCDSIATLNFTGGVTSTITQDEDSLYSSVYPSGVDYSAQWLNIDKETGETWLMGEEKNFGPRFDCNYILVTTTEDGCIDTTDVYFFAEFAGQIYDLKISPNPTRGLINIKYVNERNQFVRIYFANSNGVVLDEFISSENEMNINISNYPSGIYYVYFSSEEHCSSAEQQITRKIILNK